MSHPTDAFCIPPQPEQVAPAPPCPLIAQSGAIAAAVSPEAIALAAEAASAHVSALCGGDR